ncbi:hypothetical protein [Pedobacter nyackensis]|uniref:Uncharacterized protein n=1 Tax=Pedobacter nyackensis TaxID=475255 RepID=A0A1W2EJE1_9SPHI|nr:hypothetical protein [Pedobacter nyackensis]SMD09851.1 hypothetical protein SAMN04488101_1131 [Pedobacter nyackensis]
MKHNQPKTTESIYFIKEFSDLDIPIHVAFDDFETAKAYISRLRTFGNAQIVECQLNPGFYTDITRDCFFVQLNMRNDEATAHYVIDLQRTELATNGHYFFEGEQICVYVMALSKDGAIKAARELKDEVKRNQE